MKILIAGDGKVGAWLTRQLANEGHDITLIDSDAAILENTIAQYDVMSIAGNCASMETLPRIGSIRKPPWTSHGNPRTFFAEPIVCPLDGKVKENLALKKNEC